MNSEQHTRTRWSIEGLSIGDAFGEASFFKDIPLLPSGHSTI